MNIKLLVKRILCPMQCARFRIKHRNGFMYIGKACKISNPRNMYFEQNVSIMPYNVLVGLGEKYRLHIGENVEIGMFSRVGCLNSIEIGDNVLIGPHVFIADFNHEYRNPDLPIKNQGNMVEPRGVSIGADTWLGTNVVIAGSIHIGKHCVIGANSVVTSDIPDYSIAVGSPCKVIKKYNFEIQQWVKVKKITE